MSSKNEQIKPKKALNKAFLKVKPVRDDIEKFKANLIVLLDGSNDTESEEFHKNLVSDFLKKTYYDPNHSINTKGRNDLVIHNGVKADSTVGVIIEAKKPTNSAEMPKGKDLSSKAMQELVLYYLRERITLKNLEVKHLVVANIYEWYIFDAQEFDRSFAQDKKLVKQFQDFEAGTLAGTKTDFFYKEIAAPALRAGGLSYTYFDVRYYDKVLRNGDKADDRKLIALYKLLSPEHLLKLPFANDSNSLDKKFYSELLHIIGLAEVKDGGKKLIQRADAKSRNQGSLLESAILQLDVRDKLSRVNNLSSYGSTTEEKLFGVGLELAITWINRILFLKLLEGQLVAYHKGDQAYRFMNYANIAEFDEMDALFFQVLAKKQVDRAANITKKFGHVPYLNSSLFEPQDIEHNGLFISELQDNKTLPIHSSTVLKDDNGKKRKGELNTLEYLFAFLDAYDFASEGTEDIQEDNKQLINASVLGLIFEKINGYKDGSFFTPGFITMYMCKETIRRAVLQKFEEAKGWKCENIDALYEKIDDKKEANQLINSLTICDPAVGSGHFLVSALNEMIAIKSELGILQDRDGKTLRDYEVSVVNDELVVTNDDGEPFEYHVGNAEQQRVQETLFHEKQIIIENCLFGVDINPNSVKICQLRLWIELLKNSYYKSPTELETLPNIDINIKCGNSLISRFGLDASIKTALKKSKFGIESYKAAVTSYKQTTSKEDKKAFLELINTIKSDFQTEFYVGSPENIKLSKFRGDLQNVISKRIDLFGETMTKKKFKDEVEHLEMMIKLQQAKVEDIKNDEIFKNAFEWRFEFPEVLDDDGKYVGFDVVIGNPPYINFRDIKNQSEKKYYIDHYTVSEYQSDLFILFIEMALQNIKNDGKFAFIIPNTITNNLNNSLVRKQILNTTKIHSIVNTPIGVFPDATVDTVVIVATKSTIEESIITVLETNYQSLYLVNEVKQSEFENNENYYFDFLTSEEQRLILAKIERNSVSLNSISDSSSGIKEYETGKGIPPQTVEDRKAKIFNTSNKVDKFYRKHIQGTDVNNYFLNWKGGYLKYGKWIAAPRDPKYFEGERIVIREIPGKGRLIAAYTDDNYTVKNTAHVFKMNSDYDCKSTVAILNSKLMGYYFVNKFSERDSVFPKAKIGQCRLLPINASKAYDKPFKEKVTQILALKKEDPAADTSALEAEIDAMVYKLYGLSEEEIKIVEGA